LFGNSDPVGEGVWELRIDTGAGYRAYYARSGKQVVLLLCGGDKRKQQADIKRAKGYHTNPPAESRSLRLVFRSDDGIFDGIPQGIALIMTVK
jgi:hypothetical protein